jgi:hypothetical protein
MEPKLPKSHDKEHDPELAKILLLAMTTPNPQKEWDKWREDYYKNLRATQAWLNH